MRDKLDKKQISFIMFQLYSFYWCLLKKSINESQLGWEVTKNDLEPTQKKSINGAIEKKEERTFQLNILDMSIRNICRPLL